MNKTVYALSHYAVLATILAACWGVGRVALGGLRVAAAPGLAAPLQVTAGLGITICVLQALGIAGWLDARWVGALGILSLLLAGHQARAAYRLAKAPVAAIAPGPDFGEQVALGCLALAAATLLLRPLAPPLAWDELMYHLPHAQQWAESGKLQVNPWLRYPWFPYNFDLLYAAALLFGNDILLHATAGWLVAWLIYALGARHLSRIAGCVAAILWLMLTKAEFENAYIDMGVTLFVLCAAVAFEQARASGERRWLLVSGFMLGVALGSKYQVLGLLPFFALALLWHDRRISTWLMVAASLAVPCIYWYSRNLLLTGDPFNPIGGPFFGFTDWDLGDHKGQFDDLRRNAGLPHWLLWPALLAPAVPALRRSAAARAAMWLCAWMLLVWLFSSRYPRYLMFGYPFLILLSVGVCQPVARRLMARLPKRLARGAAWSLLVVLAAFAAVTAAKQVPRFAATPQDKEKILRAEVDGYAMWEFARKQPIGKIYQLGLEDSLYYAPQPVWGEVFGPWRYRDVQQLAAPQLHEKLSRWGFDAFAIHTARFPDVASRAAFAEWFELLHADGDVRLYRLIQKSGQ